MSDCKSCGVSLEGSEKFCGSCGQPVSAVAAPPKAEAVPASSQPSAPKTPVYPKPSARPVAAPASGRGLSAPAIIAGLTAVAAVAGYLALDPFNNAPANRPSATSDMASSAPADTRTPQELFGTGPTQPATQRPVQLQPAPVTRPAQPAPITPIAPSNPTSPQVAAEITRLKKTYADAGITALANHHLSVASCANCTPYLIYCTAPLSGVSDIKGRRVRVLPTAGGDWVRHAGGNPQMLPFSELKSALQTGVIDCTLGGGTVPKP